MDAPARIPGIGTDRGIGGVGVSAAGPPRSALVVRRLATGLSPRESPFQVAPPVSEQLARRPRGEARYDERPNRQGGGARIVLLVEPVHARVKVIGSAR